MLAHKYSLDLVRKNELLILSNQRSLVASALHLKKNEENLNISFQALNRKLLQLIYDQALGRERMNKLNLHGRIRADYRIALSEAESARGGAAHGPPPCGQRAAQRGGRAVGG